jgi:hypothetical protein
MVSVAAAGHGVGMRPIVAEGGVTLHQPDGLICDALLSLTGVAQNSGKDTLATQPRTPPAGRDASTSETPGRLGDPEINRPG